MAIGQDSLDKVEGIEYSATVQVIGLQNVPATHLNV